jgi:excisionase family DNA binding protein
VTPQTIRNWIEHGVLAAARIGRGYRIRREDIHELLARADAQSSSFATRRDVWTPTTTSLSRRHYADAPRSVSEEADSRACDLCSSYSSGAPGALMRQAVG